MKSPTSYFSNQQVSICLRIWVTDFTFRLTERRKGYATKLVELSLNKARGLGIDEVLIVCNADNTASEKAILKNGEVRDTDYIEDDGNEVHRFWIKL